MAMLRAALYCRLSKDDMLQGDSESIKTQKAMLTQYAKEHGFLVVEIYVDDGYSGLNFDRPSFNRMLDDIEAGKIDVVITKDLSRLGRDHLKVGHFTEIYFPMKNVRYIAVNDGVDTANKNNDIAALKNVIALAAGAVLLALFAWRQFSLKDPLLDLHPLVHPRFAVGMVLVMVGTMASYSLSVLLPLFFEGANGSTAFAAGLLLLGPVLVNAASSFAGGKLYDRVGAWPLIPAGLTLVVAGQVALFFLSEHLLVGLVVLSAALIYVGQGLAYTPSKTAALRQLPPDLYPHGASINSTLVQVASSIGSSLFVGVLSADVLRGTAAGLAKTQAYADGFAHTLAIAMGIVAVGLVVGFLYARAMRKPSLPKNKKV